MAEETKESKKKEAKDNFELTEVATQTEIVVRDNLNDKVLNMQQVLALILNKLDRLERALL